MSPTVTVIVPTRNRSKELGAALDSIAAQRGLNLGEIEVLVVNDGGDPIEHVLVHRADSGLVLRRIEHLSRCGLPTARNTALTSARGEFVAFLDDDDLLLPDHLSTALSQFDSGVDAVVTGCLVAEHRLQPSEPVPHGQVLSWNVPFDPALLEACNLFPVHSAVLRHPGDAWFDPDLPALEDWDFWLRLVRVHNYRILKVSESTVVYHRVPQSGSMIGAVAAAASQMAEFSTLVRHLWARWPASSARVERFRAYTAALYWQVLGQLTSEDPVNAHYYLAALQVLARAWTDPSVESDVLEHVAESVTGAA